MSSFILDVLDTFCHQIEFMGSSRSDDISGHKSSAA